MDALTPPPEPAVPVVDARDGGPVALAAREAARLRALRDACIAAFPAGVGLLVPAGDALTRRWLVRSGSPYVGEVAAIAAGLGVAGAWLLNGSYQWACTALAREEEGVPWLARTLDWPYPGLGRHLVVARLAGAAGDFFTATWPGFVGVLSAMAPGRFAACINQAPLKRATKLPWLRPIDLAANVLHGWSVRALPPDHLLRHVFETAADFSQAKVLLETTPVARPVIFTLVGCRPGECCVIERTEEAAAVRTTHTVVANDWMPARPDWEARMAAVDLLHGSSDRAAAANRAREDQLAGFSGAVSRSFDWVRPPVLNPYTRLALAMSPAEGRLAVVGYERDPGVELPRPVTARCEIVAREPA